MELHTHRGDVRFTRGLSKLAFRSLEWTRGFTACCPEGQSPSGNKPPSLSVRLTWAPLGFTLLELMTVMTLILILASIAVPSYTTAIKRAKEAVLRDDLYTMRHLIDEYTADKQQPPQALQDLVDAGYLRGGVPVDPMTGSSQSWQVDVEDVPTTPDENQSGIVDVHSASTDVSLEGSAYNTW